MGYTYNKGATAGNIGPSGDGGPRRQYPKLDYAKVRGQPVVLQFIKLYRDGDGRILHPIPAYVQGRNYWEERTTGVIYSGKKDLGQVVSRDQIKKWDNQIAILFRVMSPTDSFGASTFYRRVLPLSAIPIDNQAHTYDLILQGQGLSGAMRVLMACGLDATKACDGLFYDPDYIDKRVAENTVDPLTAEQMMEHVIEPILLEAVEQKDHMVAGKFSSGSFVELDLDDFKACTPEQVAVIRAQLDAAGLSEDTVGQVVELEETTAAPAPAAAGTPAPEEDAAWQQVTLSEQEIKEHLSDLKEAASFPEPPNFPEGTKPEFVQVERFYLWAKMVKPALRRGKLFKQLTHDDLKKIYVLLNPPQPVAVSLD